MNSKPQTTSESEPIEPGRNRRKLIMTLSLVAAALIAMVLIYIAVSDDADNNVGELFTVKKEPLIITISESGTIKPINQIVLTNELEGMTRILYLIPESTQVKKGDLLVELETSELETQKINQEIQVKNADAALVQAEANLSITTNQADSDVAQAELNKEFAEMDLEKYMKGEYPQELEQTKANITIAEEELKRAKDRLEGSKKLAEKKFISQTDLEADELAAKQKEINLKLAEGKLKLLEEYTHPRRVKELKSNIEQTTKALERTDQ